MTTTDQAAAPAADAETAAVAALTEKIVAAWADHDPAAFAAVFTEDASMILPGVLCQGRADIETFMTGAFAGPYQGTRVTGRPFAVRFLAPDVCLLLTQGGVLAPGQDEVAPDRAVRASWLAVRHGGEWRLAAYQNSPRS